MPLVKPHSGQTREEFVAACMKNKRLTSEFPDQKRHLAVCFSLYKQHIKNKRKAAADEDQSGENWEEAPIASWDDVASDIERTSTIKTENKMHLILPALPNIPNFVDPTDQK